MNTNQPTLRTWLRGEGRFLLPIFAVLLLGGWMAGYLRPRPAQVVFVKTNEVMARYKGAVQARTSFEKDTAAWAEESKQLEQKLQELGRTAKPTDAKAVEQARELSSRLKALRDKGAKHDQELMQPVLAEINAGIKKFAKKHDYKVVLGTLQGGVILHGDEALDVTEALIQDLNQ